MSVSPMKGSLSSEFSVDLALDGHGEKFNAAEATITLSKNLQIKSLALGDCDFSYLTTPSTANPSFQGVILGGSSTKCTAYTMTLIPIAKGYATITLTKASIRRLGDAANILSSVQNGSYTNTAVLSASDVNLPSSKAGLYSVVLTILTPDSKAAINTNVILNTASGKLPIEKTTNSKGIVQYTNLQPGIYTATVQGQRTIINVTGKNHILSLGIKLKPESFSLFGVTFSIIILVIACAIVILGLGIGIGLVLRRNKSHHES
ncbi:MAG TPA: hypothetical protein VG935_04930 [Patescibacteria group bacterium]|nr:hypothetical protein [Patescibacteria group bacterium]